MKIFLTGGTGAIGRHALRALIAAGHDVLAVVRTEEKAALARNLGATPIKVSIFDKAALLREMTGADAIINLATAIPPNSQFMKPSAWEMNDRIRKEGSAALVDAALEAGVPRFIQESVVMLYRDNGDIWIDEGAPTNRFIMSEGNLAAEFNTDRFAQGGDGVVLRFGWFYGPGATHSEEFLETARKTGVCVMLGAASGYLSSINVHDGGAAVAAALNIPAGVYNVVDDEPLTKRDYADAIAAAVGRRKHTLRFPGRLAYLLGDKTTSLTRSIRVSNKKFREASGWAPQYSSAREGFTALANEIL